MRPLKRLCLERFEIHLKFAELKSEFSLAFSFSTLLKLVKCNRYKLQPEIGRIKGIALQNRGLFVSACEGGRSFARQTFTTPKIRTFTTPKFGHFPPPKTKHLPGGQLPPPFFFLFLAHFSLLFRLTAYGGHQGWEGGGGHGAHQVEEA